MEEYLEEPYRFGEPSKLNPRLKYKTSKQDMLDIVKLAEQKRNTILDNSVDDLTMMFSNIKVTDIVKRENENLNQIDNLLNELENEPLENEPLENEPLEEPPLTLTEKTRRAMTAFVFSMNRSIVYSIIFVQHSTMTIFPILLRFVWYLFRFMVYLTRASVLEKAFVVLVLASINKTTWGNMFLSFIYSLINRLLQNQLDIVKENFKEVANKIYIEVIEGAKTYGTTGIGIVASSFVKRLVSDSSFRGVVTESVSSAVQSQVPALLEKNNAALSQGIQAIIYSEEFKNILLASYASTQLPEQLENLQEFLVTSNQENREQIDKIISIIYRIEQRDSTLIKQLQNYGLMNLPALTKGAKKLLELTGVIPRDHPQVELIEFEGGSRKHTHKYKYKYKKGKKSLRRKITITRKVKRGGLKKRTNKKSKRHYHFTPLKI
jgi:hypothetical protein